MRCGSGRERPSRASEPFRHIPISLSGDVVRNVSYNYPFQLGFAIYGYPETVTIRNITDFASMFTHHTTSLTCVNLTFILDTPIPSE